MRPALGLLLLAGCDPLVGEDYLGTPAFALSGQIEREGEGVSFAEERLRLSLFWIGLDSRSEVTPRVEQRTALDLGLLSFRVSLFGDPPIEALNRESRSIPSGVGIALIALYADENENETLNSYAPNAEGPDLIVGASPTHLVVFSAQPLAGDGLLQAAPAGYHLYRNTSGAVCPFVRAQTCQGHGRLERVEPDDPIVLTLYPRASEVLVPNPSVPDSSTGGNIYK